MAVEDLKQESKPWGVRLIEWVLELMIYTFGVLFAFLKGFRTEILFMFLFSVFCAVLDHDTLIKDGKFKAILDSMKKPFVEPWEPYSNV